MKNFIINFHKTLLISGLILFLSVANFNKIPTPGLLSFENADKVVHFIMYFTLSMVVMLELYYSHSKKIARQNLLAINLIPLLMSISFEFIQEYFTTTRTGSTADEIFNILGIITAIFVFRFVKDVPFIKSVTKFPFKA